MSEVNSYELTNILNYKLVNNSDLSKKYRNFFTYIYGNSCVLNTKITFIFFSLVPFTQIMENFCVSVYYCT